jgi:hypothetical protein
MSDKTFSTFAEFYPYYLAEHSHPACRAMHYIGSLLVIATLIYAFATAQWHWLWLLPVIGYGFAWIGHFFIERNRPATFTYPLYSLAADWVMLKDFLTGQLSNKLSKSSR